MSDYYQRSYNFNIFLRKVALAVYQNIKIMMPELNLLPNFHFIIAKAAFEFLHVDINLPVVRAVPSSNPWCGNYFKNTL